MQSHIQSPLLKTVDPVKTAMLLRPIWGPVVWYDHAHIGLTDGALQKAVAKQQSMLDDGASSSGDEDDDDHDDDSDDEEDDSDEDEDTAARKEIGIAYLKKALTSQPLNGNAEPDDDDDDMEVDPAQAFVVRHLIPCLHTHTSV